MKLEKLYWKSSYYWIRYLNYDYIYQNSEQHELWLCNRKKQSLIIIKDTVNSSQEIRFDKSKIKENINDITLKFNFQPKTCDFYYFSDKPVPIEDLQELQPLKISVKIIASEADAQQCIPNKFLRRLFNKKDSKTTAYYKKRVLNQNPLDKYMAKFSPATYSLITINIVIWLSMILLLNRFSNIKLLDMGGLVHFNVVHGEWYRLITSMFLHFNFEHILMNMLSLFIFGKIVEAIIGPMKMLILYIISGLFGNFLSLSFNTDTVSAGASGAIFGLIGAIIVMMIISKVYSRKMIGQLLIALVILIGFSLLLSNVNIMAHLGGFISGLLLIYIGYYYKANRNIFWLLLIVFLILFILLQVRIFTIKEDNIYNILIEDEMNHYNYNEAEKIVSQTLDNHYDDAKTYYLKGLITAATKSKAQSIAEWERGLRNYPNSGLLNYELAIANRSLSDNKKAEKYINHALKVEPNNADYLNLKKELKIVNEDKN